MAAITSQQPLALLAALAVAVALLAAAPPAAAAAQPRSVMALGTARPEVSVSRALGVISADDKLDAYLSNPDTVCTVLLPENAAMAASLRNLGKFVGVASQNTTLQHNTFAYHIIPGKALTAAQLGKLNKTLTLGNETLFVWRRPSNGTLNVYSRPDRPVELNQTDIPAGKCLVHTLPTPLVPPSAVELVQSWLEAAGTVPPFPPKSEWAPTQEPIAVAAAAPKAAAAAAEAPAAAAASAGAKASSAAGGLAQPGRIGGLAAALAAAVTAVAMLAA